MLLSCCCMLLFCRVTGPWSCGRTVANGMAAAPPGCPGFCDPRWSLARRLVCRAFGVSNADCLWKFVEFWIFADHFWVILPTASSSISVFFNIADLLEHDGMCWQHMAIGWCCFHLFSILLYFVELCALRFCLAGHAAECSGNWPVRGRGVGARVGSYPRALGFLACNSGGGWRWQTVGQRRTWWDNVGQQTELQIDNLQVAAW